MALTNGNQTTDTTLEDFKKLVRKAIFLEQSEDVYFNAIPNEQWITIFKTNFNCNLNYAQRVILNQFKDIEKIDFARVDREKDKIHNLDKATKSIISAINDKSQIIFVTDFDNDGSLSQSIINEYLNVDQQAAPNMHVEYSQTVNNNSNRGFTVDHVEKILAHKNLNPENKFLIITADNGINSLEEQIKIQQKYPNAELIVTDHHNPDPDMVIQENDKAMVFNPHYHPTPFFKQFNISGATTIGVLLKNVLKKRFPIVELETTYKSNISNIDKLSRVSNLLDYVNTDPADKPERDYVITKFLQLQPLLNINNSISKIITGGISDVVLQDIQKKIPDVDVDLIKKEVVNIQTQNKVSQILLKIHNNYKNVPKLSEAHFQEFFVMELNELNNYQNTNPLNPNFIEQLRPLIFGLAADDNKNIFMDTLNNKMIDVYESIKVSEKKIAGELRKGEVITKNRLPNSVIMYTDKNILSAFNRKYLNKIYNDENPGFALTLDAVDKAKVSGSFRSLYNISDILKNKSQLEKKLNIKIDTPGHEKAAGFIIKSTDPENHPVTDKTIKEINIFVNKSIESIKKMEKASKEEFLLIDLEAIQLIDRINVVVRGNVSNFDRISPLLKLTKDTVWTDSYTTEQYTMAEIIGKQKYGYITINTNFGGGCVIVPIELIRKVVSNDYKDYLKLSYMDDGVFMVERAVPENVAKNVIDLRNKDNKTKLIDEVFTKDFHDKNIISLNREQIKDNPFFKYHDYGQLHYDLFEKIIIGIIDDNKIDILSVVDVEANGFGNSKLMNIGSTNYILNPKSGTKISKKDFMELFYRTQRGDEYLLTKEQTMELIEVSESEKENLPENVKKQLLISHDKTNHEEYKYYLHPLASQKISVKKAKKNPPPFTQVRNHIEDEDGNIIFNRELEATMIAYLVNDNDFKVPQEMTNLTGITQEILNKHGKPAAVVDKEMSAYFEGKNVLFGAHNTPYDSKVIRANMPLFYEKLKTSKIYDSALFSREEKLAYDDVKVSYFDGGADPESGMPTPINGLPKNIYFFDNKYSEFNLTQFLNDNKNGHYPDRTGQYLLEIEDGEYSLVNKTAHEKIKLETTKVLLLKALQTGPIPNTSVKYSVEKLSEQWMIRSLLLMDEKFNIKLVNLRKTKYKHLREHKDALVFFQENYHFDVSPMNNLYNFFTHYPRIYNVTEPQPFDDFLSEFLEKNKTIQQKFSDTWMYKKVLSIKDPTRSEITNDLVDLVNYQTNIPKEKIKTIFDQAIKFKEKYNVNHVLQHEGHINGPWEGDKKGDIAFEDKLTFSLLSQRMVNPYNKEIKHAINIFNNYASKARLAFDLSDNLSSTIANDSYSFRQGLLYDRENKSPVIENMQNKESNLLNRSDEHIIKFKLGNDVLPQDSGVYAIAKNGAIVTREDIEQDSKMLSFILVNEQIKSSISAVKGSQATTENLLAILQANDVTSLKYKQELSQRYRYVEFNRRDQQIKALVDAGIEFLGSSKDKVKKTPTYELSQPDFDIVKKIINNYINTYDYNHFDNGRIDLVGNHIKNIQEDQIAKPTSLENALNDKTTHFQTFSDVNDINFLLTVQISKREPIKTLLTKHQDLRMFNQIVENSINLNNKAIQEIEKEKKKQSNLTF